VGAECLRLQDQTAAKALSSFETSRTARPTIRRHSNRPQPHPLLFTIQEHILVHNITNAVATVTCTVQSVCLSVSASLFIRYINHFALFYGEQRLLVSSCLSIRIEILSSHWTDFEFKKIIFENFSEICRENSRFINI